MTNVRAEIAQIKARMRQIQEDIGQLVATTDPHNMTAETAQEFKRISAELAELRTQLALVMGQSDAN